MNEAKQLMLELNLAAQKQSIDGVEALNTFRGPKGEPGALTDEMVGNAINKYLKDNPIQTGATPEQAAQIEANKKATEANKKAIDEYKAPVQSVNGKSGNVKLTASDVGARPDNWMPTASDVGALPSDGTAVNANTLNGNVAEYYATAESVNRLSQQKANLAGWTANKLIGTDEGGNLVAVDAPEGSGGDAETLGGVAAEEYAQKILISDAYDASRTYNSGDYCICENTLYKCIKDNVTDIAPTNTSYWEAAMVSSEIKKLEIKANLDYIGINNQGVTDPIPLLTQAVQHIARFLSPSEVRVGNLSVSFRGSSRFGTYFAINNTPVACFIILYGITSSEPTLYKTYDEGETWDTV